MLEAIVKIVPRRTWFVVALTIMAAGYLPILILPWHPAYALVPLLVSSVFFMLTMRHSLVLVLGSVGLSALAAIAIILGWVQPKSAAELSRYQAGSSTILTTIACLAASQALVGISHIAVRRSPWGVGRAQKRLAARIRRQTEELQAIEKSNVLTAQRFESDRRALLEHLPVHIVQKDLQGRFTFVTQSFCDLVNRDFSEIVGKTDADLFPEVTSRKFMEDDRRVIEQALVFDDVEQTELPDGTQSYMQVRKAPLRAADGNIEGVQGIFWDVTEAYSGRKELQRSEALAHALIHAALDAVLIVDAGGRVLEANPASEKILGYTREQIATHPPLGSIMQTTLEEVGQRLTDDAAATSYHERKVPIAKVLESATGKRIEARLRRRDGAWFDAEVSTHPLVIENSKGWAMFVRDITRRKRAEMELRSAKDSAERANAAKSEFVANVSHELRTPLTAIIGLQELLQRSEIDSRQRNYLQLAINSSSNLLNLIDDLLDFSKIEAGRVEIENVPFSLVECVEEAAASIAARAQLKGLELLVEIHGDLQADVVGDSHRIKQILLNLLGNAIKFTEAGDIRIRVSPQPASYLRTSTNPYVVRFEVHDQGIGVPVDQRSLIFDAFRQADSSTTRRYGGTGLGLAICRDLVEMMHGTISVQDSDVGWGGTQPTGSCFAFELPLQIQDGSSSTSIDKEAATSRREEVVLVAGPSPWRDLLQQQIEAIGYRLTILGVEGLANRKPARLFAAGNHSIIIVDYRELASHHLSTAPVVVRWILLSPLANPQPTSVPDWLKYSDVRWLARPVRRGQLESALCGRAVDDGLTNEPIYRSKTRHVLLVEDSPVSQTVLKDMLESLGHQVTLAGNGKEAIDACAKVAFDVVLMDIQMPEIDGLAATQHIRSHETNQAKQTIVALTAHASLEDREMCLAAGMDGFLVKPISLTDLRQALDAIGVDQADAGPNPKPSDLVSLENHGDPTNHNYQHDANHNNPMQLGFSEVGIAKDGSENSDPSSMDDAPDWPRLLTLMGGNEKLLRDVLQLIVREVPKLGKSFGQAVDKQNFKEARRAVHTLKSNVRHVGLTRIGFYAETIERSARDEQLDVLLDSVEIVQKIAGQVADWAEAMAARHKEATG